jgi:esterase/lipase superfamily enzyme
MLCWHIMRCLLMFAAIRDCRTLPVTIKDVIKAAPDLGAELADSLAAVM